MSMLEKFKEVAERNNAEIERLRQESAALVKPLLQEFVKDHPQVKAVKWTQYTPYFNDGEACVFSVNEPYFFFEGDDLEEDDGHETYWAPGTEYGPKVEQCDVTTWAACKQLAQHLGAASDALEALFGDHVRVIVSAEGVSVDEYDHD